MHISHRLIGGAAALALAAVAFQGPASADTVKVGTLSCHESSGWGFVFGATHDVRCTFFEGPDRRPEHYVGHIDKFGVDIGYQGSAVLLWDVFAPTSRLRPGALSGAYGGVTAGAAVGVGGAANALVGGSDRTISLQPLSVEGETGLNVAAGIGAMHLHYAP